MDNLNKNLTILALLILMYLVGWVVGASLNNGYNYESPYEDYYDFSTPMIDTNPERTQLDFVNELDVPVIIYFESIDLETARKFTEEKIIYDSGSCRIPNDFHVLTFHIGNETYETAITLNGTFTEIIINENGIIKYNRQLQEHETDGVMWWSVKWENRQILASFDKAVE